MCVCVCVCVCVPVGAPPSLPLLPGPLWPGVIAFCLKLTVFTFNCV